ncbi:hypothetical protein HOD30_00595 [Candidatus Peregrinibacteria bacterium]|jgi:hypothetical protein|nr:hypothetical protein [Candidatus Peregrinibacteria bacterium]MBT4631960.1 hypothetical protein [Candidatus Peregrinibacteria bacterium]MBT5516970.1 hypothetical protein [Candidatus Peregrinibacteria bacterium]MBT5823651.1 hypothetical protein [Candidatus Peregrinibacteria bacterium]
MGVRKKNKNIRPKRQIEQAKRPSEVIVEDYVHARRMADHFASSKGADRKGVDERNAWKEKMEILQREYKGPKKDLIKAADEWERIHEYVPVPSDANLYKEETAGIMETADALNELSEDVENKNTLATRLRALVNANLSPATMLGSGPQQIQAVRLALPRELSDRLIPALEKGKGSSYDKAMKQVEEQYEKLKPYWEKLNEFVSENNEAQKDQIVSVTGHIFERTSKSFNEKPWQTAGAIAGLLGLAAIAYNAASPKLRKWFIAGGLAIGGGIALNDFVWPTFIDKEGKTALQRLRGKQVNEGTVNGPFGDAVEHFLAGDEDMVKAAESVQKLNGVPAYKMIAAYKTLRGKSPDKMLLDPRKLGLPSDIAGDMDQDGLAKGLIVWFAEVARKAGACTGGDLNVCAEKGVSIIEENELGSTEFEYLNLKYIQIPTNENAAKDQERAANALTEAQKESEKELRILFNKNGLTGKSIDAMPGANKNIILIQGYPYEVEKVTNPRGDTKNKYYFNTMDGSGRQNTVDDGAEGTVAVSLGVIAAHAEKSFERDRSNAMNGVSGAVDFKYDHRSREWALSGAGLGLGQLRHITGQPEQAEITAYYDKDARLVIDGSADAYDTVQKGLEEEVKYRAYESLSSDLDYLVGNLEFEVDKVDTSDSAKAIIHVDYYGKKGLITYEMGKVTDIHMPFHIEMEAAWQATGLDTADEVFTQGPVKHHIESLKEDLLQKFEADAGYFETGWTTIWENTPWVGTDTWSDRADAVIETMVYDHRTELSDQLRGDIGAMHLPENWIDVKEQSVKEARDKFMALNITEMLEGRAPVNETPESAKDRHVADFETWFNDEMSLQSVFTDVAEWASSWTGYGEVWQREFDENVMARLSALRSTGRAVTKEEFKQDIDEFKVFIKEEKDVVWAAAIERDLGSGKAVSTTGTLTGLNHVEAKIKTAFNTHFSSGVRGSRDANAYRTDLETSMKFGTYPEIITEVDADKAEVLDGFNDWFNDTVALNYRYSPDMLSRLPVIGAGNWAVQFRNSVVDRANAEVTASANAIDLKRALDNMKPFLVVEKTAVWQELINNKYTTGPTLGKGASGPKRNGLTEVAEMITTEYAKVASGVTAPVYEANLKAAVAALPPKDPAAKSDWIPDIIEWSEEETQLAKRAEILDEFDQWFASKFVKTGWEYDVWQNALRVYGALPALSSPLIAKVASYSPGSLPTVPPKDGFEASPANPNIDTPRLRAVRIACMQSRASAAISLADSLAPAGTKAGTTKVGNDLLRETMDDLKLFLDAEQPFWINATTDTSSDAPAIVAKSMKVTTVFETDFGVTTGPKGKASRVNPSVYSTRANAQY